MAVSQNGWPVVGQGSVVDRAVLGVEFPNGWLKGDVDVIFTYLIGRLHREVERLDDGGCWGWFVKNIEGSSSISNHASGTAIDYNAPAHPMGVRNTYSSAKRSKIRAILDDLDGVVRWGGDYSGRPDDMHFEINKNAAAVRKVAARIKGEDVPITPAEINDIAEAVWAFQLEDPLSTSTPKAKKSAGAYQRYVDSSRNQIKEMVQQAIDEVDQDSAIQSRLKAIQTAVDALGRDPGDPPPAG